jgi:hypothetical protein
MAASALLLPLGCVQILGLHDRADAPSVDGGNADADTTRVGSDAGLDAAAPAEAGIVAGTCGGMHHPSPSCAACMDETCCDEAVQCAGDPACLETSDCLVGCTDAACRAKCAVFYTRPDTLIALRACRINHCAAECGSTCGEYASMNAGCESCRETSCCAQSTACATNPACAKLDLCRSNCTGSMSCPADCNAAFPDGTADYAAWFQCADTSCGAACQSGQDWSCLDQSIVWPRPKASGNIAFSVTIVDLDSEKPYAGAVVKACEKLDLPCARPIDQSTTDDTGLVELSIPGGLNGFDGYLDVTGGRNEQGSPIFPAIWYPEPRVVADGWRGTFQFISVDELTLLGFATGTTIDPQRGHFAANAADCDFTAAASVSFTADGADDRTKSFYFVQGIPSTAATATDRSAIGGFVNLPAGDEDAGPGRLVLVRATSGAAGNKGLGALSFIIRPGTFTTSSFPPVP